MEISVTRKREITEPPYKEKNQKYTIYEQLFLISLQRYTIPRICDSLSLCLRAAILADLSFIDAIETPENVIVNTLNTTDPILEEAYKKIKKYSVSIKDTLIALNGETFTKMRSVHLKRLRHKISKKLEDRGVLRYETKVFMKGKAFVDESAKKEISDKIIEFLEGKNDCLKTEVLIGCLIYCDALKPLFFSLSVKKVSELEGRANSLRKKWNESIVGRKEPENTIYGILKTLFKL